MAIRADGIQTRRTIRTTPLRHVVDRPDSCTCSLLAPGGGPTFCTGQHCAARYPERVFNADAAGASVFV